MEIDNKAILIIGIGTLMWGIAFDALNIIVAHHF